MHHEAFEKFFQSVIGEAGLSDDLINHLRSVFYDLVTSGQILLPDEFVSLGANDHDIPDLVGGIDLDDNDSLSIDQINFNKLFAGLNSKLVKKVDPQEFFAMQPKKNNDIASMLFAKPTGSETITFIQPSTNEATMNAPCKYNTFVTSSFKLLSEHYHYANVVEGISVCSHPTVANKPSSSVAPCLYMHNQMECSMYASNAEVLATASAPMLNTSRVDQFSLIYTPMINFFENQFAHAFIIQNMNDNSIVSQMLLPDHEFVYDDALVEAERIFDEYMTAYTQISKTGPVLSEEVEMVPARTQSYFNQLFS